MQDRLGRGFKEEGQGSLTEKLTLKLEPERGERVSRYVVKVFQAEEWQEQR